MNPERPTLVRAAMAAAAIVLVLGIVGLFTVDDDDDQLVASDRTTTTAEESADDVAIGTTTVPGETTTTDVTTRASQPTTTAGGTTAAPDPGPTKAPAAGAYAYSFTNSGDPSANGDTETKFEVLPPENGAPRRRETYKDASGTTLVHEETWASDAVRITKSRISAQQGTIDCTWQPPVLVLQLPLAVGKAWSADSTCTTTAQGLQITVHQVTQSKVTGKSLERIGGVSVATWVIESTGTASIKTPFGPSETTTTVIRKFAADRGLVTEESGSGRSANVNYEYKRVLKSLTPK